MNERKIQLSILLIDDDEDWLDVIPRTIGTDLDGMALSWDRCNSFEQGLAKLSERKYDAVISDVYEGKSEKLQATGLSIVDDIRQKQFCPIVLISAGAMPEKLKLTAFVDFADKSGTNNELETSIKKQLRYLPRLVRKLHDEIDSHGGSYLWQHLDAEWDELKDIVGSDEQLMERLIRRRISVQLARMIESEANLREIDSVRGLEFYLYPCISGNDFRLGDVIQHKSTGQFRVILTPHCQLAVQKGETCPRADSILTVKTVSATDLLPNRVPKRSSWPADDATDAVKDEWLRKKVNPVVEIRPEGRYWFLPHYLKIPDLYCDFAQVESVIYDDLKSGFDRIATLDTPFAESMQSCFAGFYSAVGITNLVGGEFRHLLDSKPAAPPQPAGKPVPVEKPRPAAKQPVAEKPLPSEKPQPAAKPPAAENPLPTETSLPAEEPQSAAKPLPIEESANTPHRSSETRSSDEKKEPGKG